MLNHAIRQKPEDAGFSGALPAPGRLRNKRALITGGETPLGRAIAAAFAREGADIALVCPARADSETMRRAVLAEGRRYLAIHGDIRDLDFCDSVLDEVLARFGGLDILVNNAAGGGSLHALNFATLYLSRNALRAMDEGASIINTASGGEAVPAFTHSLSQVAARHGIRVNAVATVAETARLAANSDGEVMVRPGSPAPADAIAPSYVFLASSEARLMNGQVLKAYPA